MASIKVIRFIDCARWFCKSSFKAYWQIITIRNIIAGFMSVLIAIQPVSADIVSDPSNGTGTNVYQAGNGITTVDIATPNSAGLSHNRYEQFSVVNSGVILNNATDQLSLSQLGGLLQGNPNLASTGAASVILNEVTSTHRSILEGAIEVHGANANVILANPYGITCNGCGFINTSRVTLSTGTPEIGSDGSLSSLRITGGDILIGANGADMRSSAIFDILSRRISVQGPIASNGNLNLIAGQNSFGYQNGSTTSLASDGNEPDISIDSYQLGGMYGNRITLVSMDTGSGVNMQGQMAANAGQITLTSDGRLVFTNAQATGAIRATSNNNEVSAENTIFSDTSVVLEGHTEVNIANIGHVSSAGDVTLTGGDITLGQNVILAAGVDSDGNQTSNGTLSLTGSTLDNSGSMGSASGALDVKLSGNLENTGLIYSKTRSIYHLDGTFENENADIIAETDLTIKGLSRAWAGALTNTSGVIESVSGNMMLHVASLENTQPGPTVLHISTSNTTTSGDAGLLSGGNMVINTGSLSGSKYNKIVVNGDLKIGNLEAEVTGFTNDSGFTGNSTVDVDSVNLSLNNVFSRGALFKPTTDPSRPFLVETRPQFLDPSSLLGSDYFLGRIGDYNPDQTMRRFADTYIETRLIQDQTFELTGNRYLQPGIDERSQMQARYDNAIDAQRSLQLTVGVSLSLSQVEALKTNIAWLETPILQEQEVLVPRVYLAKSARDNLNYSTAQISGAQ